MNIMVVDAQGGGLGKQLVSAIKKNIEDAKIIAVGTNSAATTAMLKAGADVGATGENPVIVCSKEADFIVGPIGIVIADAMYGEITPKMATAISQSRAKRILLPMNHCDNVIAGVENINVATAIESVVNHIKGSETCNN